jgi:hypothetical protein
MIRTKHAGVGLAEELLLVDVRRHILEYAEGQVDAAAEIRSVDLEATANLQRHAGHVALHLAEKLWNEAPCKESCAQDGEEAARARVGRRVAVEHFRQGLHRTPGWVSQGDFAPWA